MKISRQDGIITTKSTAVKKVKTKTKTVASVNKNQSGDIFDDDDFPVHNTADLEDIYDFGSPPPAITPVIREKPSRRKPKGDCASEDPSQHCYKDLLHLRDEVRVLDHTFLNIIPKRHTQLSDAEDSAAFEDTVLQTVSAILPTGKFH